MNLHRSITFWSGLLVLACLTWAWRDSLHSEFRMRYRYWSLSNANAGLMLAHWGSQSWQHFDMRHDPVSPYVHKKCDIFPAPQILNAKPGNEDGWASSRMMKAANTRAFHAAYVELWPPGARAYFIPYWLITASILLPWLGLLAWRAKRRRNPHIESTFRSR